jgi:hypothetical protein
MLAVNIVNPSSWLLAAEHGFMMHGFSLLLLTTMAKGRPWTRGAHRYGLYQRHREWLPSRTVQAS